MTVLKETENRFNGFGSQAIPSRISDEREPPRSGPYHTRPVGSLAIGFETVETVFLLILVNVTWLKPGANEIDEWSPPI
jgi:hypothetical protein